jgi:hypothetical protein
MQTAKEDAEKTDTQKHKLMLAMRATDMVSNLDLDLDLVGDRKQARQKNGERTMEVEFDSEFENPANMDTSPDDNEGGK